MDNKPSEKKSVLIVENDVRLVREFSERCRLIGMDVSTALDAREASIRFDRELPDLLIFNEKLEAGNNRTFLECLGGYEDTRDIPMILLSDQPNWKNSPASENALAYRVHKRIDNWWRIEMFIFELVDLDPSYYGNNSSKN